MRSLTIVALSILSILLVSLVIFTSSYTYKIYQLQFYNLDPRSNCTYDRFYSRVYRLLLTSAGTTENTLNLKRHDASFNTNDINVFENDVRMKKVDIIIMNGRPYYVEYDQSDAFHSRFFIKDMCSKTSFPFVRCTEKAHVKTLLSGVITVLGFSYIRN